MSKVMKSVKKVRKEKMCGFSEYSKTEFSQGQA